MEYGILGNGQYTTNTKPVCLNDIKGTELYNAQVNNPDLKFVKVQFIENTIYAIDNTGKLWSWGYNYYGNCGNKQNTNVLSPTCISNIEGTDLYNAHQNNSIKIVDIDENGYLTDNTGTIWEITWVTDYTEAIQTVKQFKDSVTGDLLNAYNSSSEFEAARIYDDGNIVVGNDGKVYRRRSDTKEYVVVNNLTGITEIYNSYTTSEYLNDSTQKISTARWIAFGKDGVYEIYEYIDINTNSNVTNSYELTASKLTSSTIKKAIQIGTKTVLALDTQGKIWCWGTNSNSGISLSGTTTISMCLSDNSSYALYGKEIVDIDQAGSTYFATDVDGNLYAWGGHAFNSVPTLMTRFDETLKTLYGEATNENRKELIGLFGKNNVWPGSPYFISVATENGIYKVNMDTSLNAICTEYPIEEYLEGIGKIEKVIGEYEIQTADGKMYRLTPTSNTTFTLDEIQEVPTYTQPEVEPVEIEGVNLVKQTKYKALDENGKLYVWDDYTGMSTDFDGIVCLTDEQYYTQPIYLRSNGWSIIKNQF